MTEGSGEETGKVKCIICDGTTFAFGPGGRVSTTKKLPRCEKCQSLERHRAFRRFFQQAYSPRIYSTLSVLQFSNDFSVKPVWFKKYEVSIFGKQNSLDIQNIDRPTGAYDLIICNHVLEHVPDDGAAMKELVRVIEPDGTLFLSVPAPLQYKTTREWGFPDPKRHGHYREYGQNISERFGQHIPSVFAFAVDLEDEVTGAKDIAFVLVHKRNAFFRQLIASGTKLVAI